MAVAFPRVTVPDFADKPGKSCRPARDAWHVTPQPLLMKGGGLQGGVFRTPICGAASPATKPSHVPAFAVLCDAKASKSRLVRFNWTSQRRCHNETRRDQEIDDARDMRGCGHTKLPRRGRPKDTMSARRISANAAVGTSTNITAKRENRMSNATSGSSALLASAT